MLSHLLRIAIAIMALVRFPYHGIVLPRRVEKFFPSGRAAVSVAPILIEPVAVSGRVADEAALAHIVKLHHQRNMPFLPLIYAAVILD